METARVAAVSHHQPSLSAPARARPGVGNEHSQAQAVWHEEPAYTPGLALGWAMPLEEGAPGRCMQERNPT
jgi:hypothetical protein